MRIIVCPLSLVPAQVEAHKPSHLITLLDPDHVIDTPAPLTPDRHLRIGVNDITERTDGLLLAQEEMVRDILDFGATWDEAAPIIVHCWAGVSRSTATAFILACERNPQLNERDIAQAMRRASAAATPNRRLVELADDMLGRRGYMVDAVNSIGRGEYVFENTPFHLPARF
jgi:predicted protein tyrosine phosphatase